MRRALALSLLVAAVGLVGCLDGGDPAPATPGDDATGLPGSGEDGTQQPGEGMYAPGWPSVDEAVIRPGVRIVQGEPFSGTCTANYVFSSPDNRTLYLGTASHCVTGQAIGDPIAIGGGVVTGTLVYCSWGGATSGAACEDKEPGDDGFEDDFALVHIPDDARSLVHPALMHWGGPTGIASTPVETDTLVLTYGNTPLRDGDQDDIEIADPREGYVDASTEASTRVTLVPASISGDSGSPILLHDGRALGVVQTVSVGTSGVANGVVNLAAALASLEARTGAVLELKTFQLLDEPTLPHERPGGHGLTPG